MAEKGPSYDWISRFLKRNKKTITLRTAHPLDHSHAAVEQGSIDNFYDLLERALERIGQDPLKLFNMDESGVGKSKGRGF